MYQFDKPTLDNRVSGKHRFGNRKKCCGAKKAVTEIQRSTWHWVWVSWLPPHYYYLTERAPTIKHHVILYHRRITIHFSIVFLRPVSSLFSCCYCCCSLTISKSAIVSHDCGDGCWVVLPLRCKQMKAIRLKEQQLSDRRRRQLSDKLPPRRRVKVSNTDGKYCRPGDHEEQVGAFPRRD